MNKPNYPKLKLKQGRDWSVKRGHPWLFSGGLQNPSKQIEPGEIVDLEDTQGEFVARGYYNPKTDIAIRILTYNPAEVIDTAFFVNRLTAAYELRRANLDLSQTNVFRLANAEGDFLPGLICDYYGGAVVIQSHTAGIDRHLDYIIEALDQTVKPDGILVRNDVGVRSREGLKKEDPRQAMGVVPTEITVKENGYNFVANLWKGQKTGFYSDQRDKRQALQRYARGEKLLNCFCYTAGFSVYAAKNNPAMETTNIDQSGAALEIARQNFEINGLEPTKHIFQETDAFTFLQNKPGLYNTVVLDPPAFTKSHKEKDKALQGYTRLNSLGLPLVKEGGYLMTCSCSGAVTMEDFEGSLAQAAFNAGRKVQMLETFQNGLDHPVNIFTPESRYLKVLVCRVS